MIRIEVSQKGARADTIEKLVRAAIATKFPEASIGVSRHEPPESRSDRFAEALSEISDAKSEIESLRDELQDWLDNLPENLQSGTKAEELESAISELEDCISNIETVEDASVEFPSMF